MEVSHSWMVDNRQLTASVRVPANDSTSCQFPTSALHPREGQPLNRQFPAAYYAVILMGSNADQTG